MLLLTFFCIAEAISHQRGSWLGLPARRALHSSHTQGRSQMPRKAPSALMLSLLQPQANPSSCAQACETCQWCLCPGQAPGAWVNGGELLPKEQKERGRAVCQGTEESEIIS